MVDQSDLAFRMQTRKYQADLVYTQMYNSNTALISEAYREEMVHTCSGDRPLIAQIAGHDPQVMLQTAKYLEPICDAIDINLGCPQGIAKRGHYGAFLMEELDLLHEIVSTLVQGLKVPVTCKTRIYKDFDRSIRLCETLVNAGASMLVIHGRTREEKGQAVGPADWEMIRRIKSHFANRIPIIANGGISSIEEINECLVFTGVDGVMTSEAILENPSLFTSNLCPVRKISMNQMDLAEEYLQLCEVYPPRHVKTIRSHMMRFMYRYYIKHDEVRDLIAVANSIEEFMSACKFCRSLVGDQEAEYTSSWYARHRQSSVAGDGDETAAESMNRKAADGFLADNSCWECLDGGSNEEQSEYGIFEGLKMFESQ
jgi:tRNA-dihydrouridine synthase 1